MVLDKALSDRLDNKAEGADEVEYNGKRYVRSGPKNSASKPGPWREATYTKGDIKKDSQALDKALSDRLDNKAEGADEVEYNGKRYVRSGPKNSASKPGPWREATSIKKHFQVLDKGKLINRDQFEEEQDPSWHATLINGGYSVYLKADKPIAIFSRKDGQGYILQPGEWTGSRMDLVNALKALLVNESLIGSLLKYIQPL
jgi:hypothetical protein